MLTTSLHFSIKRKSEYNSIQTKLVSLPELKVEIKECICKYVFFIGPVYLFCVLEAKNNVCLS